MQGGVIFVLIEVGIQVADLDEADFNIFDVLVVVITRCNAEVTPVIQTWHVEVFEALRLG